MDRSGNFEASGSAEGRYRLLVESISDYAIYMLDPNGVIANWNAGAQRFKGYLAEEIVGENFARFYSAEDQEAGVPRRNLERAATTGRFEEEGWRYRKDGSRFWASVVIDRIIGPSGEIVGFAKVTRDLSERRAQEELLRRSQEQFRLLVKGVTDYALYMLDLQGNVASWNAGAERIKGYREAEIIGQHFSRFYGDEERAAGEPERNLEVARTTGSVEREGWRYRNDGSRFWAHVIIDAIHDDSGSLVGYAKVTRDITQQRSAREELERAQEALRHSQKMEAVGQLTGGLAHDFNNILAGISGSLELMQTRLAQGRTGDLDRYLSGAQGAAKRAAGLTQRLLAFSRRQTLDPKPTDLNRLIGGMQELVERSVGPTVKVECVAAGGLWGSFVDQGQLENALLNLCLNARDAMPDGGKLTIETGNRWMDESAAKQRGLQRGQYVSLCVSDTGTGMSMEVIERAFDPFFTTKPTGQGTGLGLSMVYGFAGQSDGAVRIYSELGRGTTVCIYLPRFNGDATAVTEVPDTLTAPRSSEHETILLVDDEPLVRMVATEILAELGYNVLEAEDGPSALNVLKSDRTIDLLVTDVGLPNGMNGRQLADVARGQRPTLQVLFITGFAENAVLNHGHLDPGMHVMTKPFASEHFARRIKELVENSKQEVSRPPVR